MTTAYTYTFVCGRIDHYEKEIEIWWGDKERVAFLMQQLSMYYQKYSELKNQNHV